MQVNAVINSTAGTKKINTTISHLRQSQESKAEQLAIALNALTTNTYKGVQVNEIGITDFDKADPELTINFETATGILTVHSLSTYTPTVLYTKSETLPATYNQVTQYNKNGNTYTFTIPTPADVVSIIVSVTESSVYKKAVAFWSKF